MKEAKSFTMPRSIELLVHDSRIDLYRKSWSSPFDMVVTLCPINGAESVVYDFPASTRHLQIIALASSGTYHVRLAAKAFSNRLLHPTHFYRIQPLSKPPQVLVFGSGRCGTTSIAEYLDGLKFNDGCPVRARHETLFEFVLPSIIRGDYHAAQFIFTGFCHDIESAPHWCLIAEKLSVEKIVHIIRDGRNVVQSGINRGWYQKDDIWERIKPPFQGSPFEKSCRFWNYMVQRAGAVAHKTFRLEDIAASLGAVRTLTDFLGILPTDKPFPKANKGKSSSSFDHWSTEHKRMFGAICGEMMDLYYPGWNNNW